MGDVQGPLRLDDGAPLLIPGLDLNPCQYNGRIHGFNKAYPVLGPLVARIAVLLLSRHLVCLPLPTPFALRESRVLANPIMTKIISTTT